MIDKYRLIFFRYIYDKLNLKEVERYLESNSIEYIINNALMCKEEKLCYNYSKYFYLLNNIDFSLLTKDELDYFNSINENSIIDNKMIDFLEKSYYKVFFGNPNFTEKHYGPSSNSYYVKGDCIVLGLKYNELGFSTGKIKTRLEIENNNKIIVDVIEKIESNKNYQVKVLKYNELFEKLNK